MKQRLLLSLACDHMVLELQDALPATGLRDKVRRAVDALWGRDQRPYDTRKSVLLPRISGESLSKQLAAGLTQLASYRSHLNSKLGIHVELGGNDARVAWISLNAANQGALSEAETQAFAYAWMTHNWALDARLFDVRWDVSPQGEALVLSCTSQSVRQELEAFCAAQSLGFETCRPALLSLLDALRTSVEFSESNRILALAEVDSEGRLTPLLQMVAWVQQKPALVSRFWLGALAEGDRASAVQGLAQRMALACQRDAQPQLVERVWPPVAKNRVPSP